MGHSMHHIIAKYWSSVYTVYTAHMHTCREGPFLMQRSARLTASAYDHASFCFFIWLYLVYSRHLCRLCQHDCKSHDKCWLLLCRPSMLSTMLDIHTMIRHSTHHIIAKYRSSVYTVHTAHAHKTHVECLFIFIDTSIVWLPLTLTMPVPAWLYGYIQDTRVDSVNMTASHMTSAMPTKYA